MKVLMQAALILMMILDLCTWDPKDHGKNGMQNGNYNTFICISVNCLSLSVSAFFCVETPSFC